MIEKMKLLHIAGPREDIDRVVKLYLNKYEIHFENAMTSLGSLKHIRPFVETNVYKEVAQRGRELKQYLEADKPGTVIMRAMQAQVIIDEVYGQIEELHNGQKELQGKILKLKEWIAEISLEGFGWRIITNWNAIFLKILIHCFTNATMTVSMYGEYILCLILICRK